MPGKMTIGQMFVVGFRGCDIGANAWLVEAIARDGLGGVILFDRNVDRSVQNIESPEQLRRLTAGLQQQARTPLFIAVDQEGGRVCRLKERDGFLPSHSAAELAALGIEATAHHADILAEELAACGINLNFAPVVDLDLNPDNPIIGRYQRSFGADPATVASHARVFVEAHHRHGVGCCLKHFPGHGSAGNDSHLGFVDISACWRTVELDPYRQLLAAGYGDGIMTAHLVNRRLDSSGLPATLSASVIDELLRRELGFDGVVFSDDLQMRAISNGWSTAEAVQRAVLAGVDVLVIGNNLTPRDDAFRAGVDAIEQLLDSGRIDGQRIERSLARIARFKEQLTGKQPWNSTVPPTA
ncbi:glycoside hydrolase family 3 domain protein [Desulfobulbus propionicus DSM 2032]|uniref:beta-N-acetylhexosaminidase n=1 Tax=Desulfobulbus propionicus (strain ATCC 33891 / DSM 2032 / VKM B-1956 / 1pr3) TaxID=577650 RepID=A0A7U3YLR1_DESPD|nr:beta-N-acetylhexosaminidase [Desulfobulbus propionicus]ADW17721.1 glycoside hydrolase family 3 domain protein [Desulfobulbus propionicus DSM 2032]